MNIPSSFNERHSQAVQSAIESIQKFLPKDRMTDEMTVRREIEKVSSAIRCLDEHPDHRATYSDYLSDLREAQDQISRKEKSDKCARAYYVGRSELLQRELINGCGFPSRHAGLSLLTWAAHTDEQLSAIEAVHAWALEQIEARSGRSVLLYGPPGTGKTHLACAIGLHLWLIGFRGVVYSNAADIVRTIRSAYDDDNLTEKQAFEKFTKPGLLIMDEVGVGKDSEFSRETLHTVISKRYDAKLPTIFITNANAKDFRAAIMERAWDRLQEDNVLQVRMTWESFRTAPRSEPSRFAAPFPPPAPEEEREKPPAWAGFTF